MEFIPKNPLLEFNPDTLTALRRKYNYEKTDEMEQAVSTLSNWINKQSHFKKKNYSGTYLEKTIIMNKGSIERAKAQMDKLSTLKSSMPAYFDKYNAKNDFAYLRDHFVQILLPKLTQDHNRVYIGMFISDGLPDNIFLDTHKFGILLTEYFKAQDYCDGAIVIIDCRKINSFMDFITGLNLVDLRKIVTISMEGYDTRIKSMHFIQSSKAIEILIKIMKQMLSTKIGERIYVHKSHETLWEHLPREILPTEYGGNEAPLLTIYDKWIEELSTKSNVEMLKEMFEASSDESLRQTDLHDDYYKRMAGSFRSLNID